MIRDIPKYTKWMRWSRVQCYLDFRRARKKAIEEAKAVIASGIEIKSGEGQLRQAMKMKFYFEKVWLVQYGDCDKFHKSVAFIPNTCQIDTQHCFENRRIN